MITLFAATAFVLLIGCANLANLALARGLARGREVAVRASVGAGRWRLARYFLTESLVLAFAGGIVGIGLGYALMRWVRALLPPFTLPAEVSVELDTTVLLFAVGVMLLTGVLFGLAPAVQATRTNLTDAMKGGGTGAAPSTPGRRLRAGLVVAEVALAFVLLFGTGLLIRSLSSLLAVDPGFDPTNVLTASLRVPQQQYPEPAELNTYLESIRAAVEAVPGVREVALTSALPLQGWGYGMPFQIANRENVGRANRTGGFFKMVSPSYFQTLGIKVIAGRGLSEADRAGAPPAAVINETMAKRDFANEDPIGQRVLVQQIVPGKTQLGDEIAWEIVGVIADEKITGLNDTESAGLYVTVQQSPVYGVGLVVRAAIEPAGLEAAVRQAVANVSKTQPVANVRTLQQITDQSVGPNRVQSILLGIFAASALMLAAVGIYGVIAYAVTQRTHEMGIRAAIGASAADLKRMMFRGGMRLVAIGLVLGLVGALAVGRLLGSMLFGVRAYDPTTATVVAGMLAGVAAVACLVPAHRATKVDPLAALREQ